MAITGCVLWGSGTGICLVGLRNPKFPPKFEAVDIVFSLLIMLHCGVYNDIPVDVLFSPLSNLKYSRWRPRWLSRTNGIINFPFVSFEV